MFAQIYEGCNCKEGTWQVTKVPIIDTERDECHDELMCDVCGQLVTKEKKDEQGRPYMHPLSDEEIRAEIDRGENDPDDHRHLEHEDY